MTNIVLGIAQTERGANSLPPDIPADLKAKIFERDDHTCGFCGFQAQKYMDVHVKDGDLNNHRLDNLQTACIFCNQCFDLEKVARMKSGVLIWLPEISQTELNHMARAIFVARISQGSMAETAKKALEFLLKRREEATNRIFTDDPYILSMVMRDFLGPKAYRAREKKLDGIRLFPLDRRIIKEGDLEFNQFPQILAYWRSKSGPFGGKAPATWKDAYAALLHSQAEAA
jgi:intracellular multiplication protein IcmJ